MRILKGIDDSLYDALNLSTHLETKNLQKNIMQEIMLSPTSDTIWDIAPPSQKELFNKISQAIETKSQSITLRLTYSFLRKNPPGNQLVSISNAVDITKLKNSDAILNQLYNAVDPKKA